MVGGSLEMLAVCAAEPAVLGEVVAARYFDFCLKIALSVEQVVLVRALIAEKALGSCCLWFFC